MKTWIELSGQVLRANYRALAKIVAPAKVLAVVKSDAYGHGLSLVAEALKNVAEGFAVDRVEEGTALRDLDIQQPIVVLGYVPPAQLLLALDARLELTVASFEQLQQLHFTTQERQIPCIIHLEVETGLYRQGIPEEELAAVAQLLHESPWMRVKGLYTHFANVEEDEVKAYPRLQLERFKECERRLQEAGIKPVQRHTACSAAALGLPESRFDAVRAGIALYGVWSSELTKEQAKELGIVASELHPALVWKTLISQVKNVKGGETVGYARAHAVTQDARLAVLPIGYYDGYTRLLSEKGRVVIHGQPCPIVGRICMNMCMIDVTDVQEPLQAGTEVTLIGPGAPVEDVYMCAGTIHHDIFARLSPSIPRRLVD